MLRPLSFIQKLLSSFRNNFIIKSFLKAPKVLYHSEASKEACVLSYYGLFSCIPILVFFLRLSQYLFISLDWKEWLLPFRSFVCSTMSSFPSFLQKQDGNFNLLALSIKSTKQNFTGIAGELLYDLLKRKDFRYTGKNI